MDTNNKEYTNHLGPLSEEDKFEKYIGKYYSIYYGNDISVGRIIYMNSNKIILNPFKGYRYDPKEEKLRHFLVEEDSEITFNKGLSFLKLEPTTKETLEAICGKLNEKDDSLTEKDD